MIFSNRAQRRPTDGAYKGSVDSERMWRIEPGTGLSDDMRNPYFANPST